jgi:WXXGXW repeat (2 copies)
MLKLIRVRFILLALLLGMTPSLSSADISITIAPPPLAVYDQPLCPGDGYIWVPGYWAYGEDDYYWVPGVWVLAPQPGYLWTPGYWGFEGGHYGWHAATGGVASVSMAVLTMGSVISDPVLSAADGKVADFSATPRFGM